MIRAHSTAALFSVCQAEDALAVRSPAFDRQPAEADPLRAHLLRRKGDTGPGRDAFTLYIERAPGAADAPMIAHDVNTL
ncbi:hypothetical protein [Methyloversatilis sp. MC4-4]|uniref:hypothetical protein n=1 Tax=Methyloversatilis sp. MC4-4 TaxID=3132824 RepID=UPI003CEF60E4